MATTPPPQLYGGEDFHALMNQMMGPPGSPVQTRSGRISRPPPTPQKADETDEAATPQECETPKPPDSTAPRKRGRPRLDPEERARRLRQRNKDAAHQSRKRRREEADENLELLEGKTRECRMLEDRCHELEAQVRELQATLQAHRIPLPSVPGPSRSWRDYRNEQASRNPDRNHASPAVSIDQSSPAFVIPQAYPPVYAGLEALANAALPNLAPHPMAHVTSLNPTSAIGDLSTPLHTTPAAGPLSIDPDIQAALDALNFPAYTWRPDDDAISLSALFTLDDLAEDANDGDFVPPTSPKGESESDSDDDDEYDDEDEKGKGRGKGTGKKRPAPTPTPPDEEEDLFLPIEDVPVPEDQLYADAMKALGVSTPDELKVVVNKIVETASRGGVTPEQVEGLRRLMRLAEPVPLARCLHASAE
ncbi:hypothetical protein CcaverHIS002_0208620 [Cutaneotrichosporon cavernicola]|nr:hypothetical protein CcaverHIS002_0208620 [Cutaneotrichosporon cavernicola]BEI97274.1 hypothetical protein CcaverHIS631_0208630 [Cutaneotrichosporon cavernicola]BEJ05048.1 hypothetical protein CcaverHIS641_0208650 [Cutaneotrichosporon cavernicola]